MAADPVTVHGSTTVDAILMTPFKAEIEQEGGVPLVIRTSNSGRGVLDLNMGGADMAMISAPLDDVVARLKQTSGRVVDPSQFNVHEIGHARILFVVNSATPVPKLNREQLAAVLTGGITKWSDVGGPTQPITVVSEQAAGAMRTEVVAKVLGGQEITASAATVSRAVEVVDLVRSVPGAVGFVSSATPKEKLAQVALLDVDANLTQTLIVVTRRDSKPDVQQAVSAIRKVASAALGH